MAISESAASELGQLLGCPVPGVKHVGDRPRGVTWDIFQ